MAPCVDGFQVAPTLAWNPITVFENPCPAADARLLLMRRNAPVLPPVATWLGVTVPPRLRTSTVVVQSAGTNCVSLNVAAAAAPAPRTTSMKARAKRGTLVWKRELKGNLRSWCVTRPPSGDRAESKGPRQGLAEPRNHGCYPM